MAKINTTTGKSGTSRLKPRTKEAAEDVSESYLSAGVLKRVKARPGR